ncbi:hypothetical protein Nepgr_013197 [Nepenthes gracilis]|uniref:Uncharacterized protein n=1 Tax=Nepenthes gracilis TaxID=150966 RepID=A0AAD3XP21_NEPGR|nr:hypothetical protein Nepgr_013197 [Nepenthes gracilis]
MLILGMKPITGVRLVTIKRTKNTFIISKIEDLSSQLQTQAAQQFRVPNMGSMIAKSEAGSPAQEEEEVDEMGVGPRAIDQVMPNVRSAPWYMTTRAPITETCGCCYLEEVKVLDEKMLPWRFVQPQGYAHARWMLAAYSTGRFVLGP